MEGRGRSRARKKHRIIVPKRLVAFMMTALMVFTTIGPDLSVAFAASEADVVFELDGADLVQSVEDAVAEGNEVTKEDVIKDILAISPEAEVYEKGNKR